MCSSSSNYRQHDKAKHLNVIIGRIAAAIGEYREGISEVQEVLVDPRHDGMPQFPVFAGQIIGVSNPSERKQKGIKQKVRKGEPKS